MNSVSLPLVSIVVPVYNVEEYVSECINSLLSQTYPHLEILLVNDGSTDSSGALIETVTDARVRVFHQTNGGLSSARNLGLKYANGEFLCFVDSDDVVREDFVEQLVNAAIAHDCDLVICNLISFSDDSVPNLTSQPTRARLVSSDEAIDSLYRSDSLVRYTVSVTKLYHRNLYTLLNFPDGRLHEDVATALPVILNAHQICELDGILYFYRDNPRSIMNSPSWAHLDGLVFYEEHYRTLSELGHPAADQARLASFKTAMANLVEFSRDPDKNSTARFQRLLSHMQWLARRLELDSLRPRDSAVVIATRVCPQSAVFLYATALDIKEKLTH